MVTSATLDISKYASTTDTSSAKSSSDKSSDFGNILDNVNKTFGSEQSSDNKISDAKTADKPKTQEKTKNTDSSDDSGSKVEDAKADNNQNVENKTGKEEVNEKTADNDSKNTKTDAKDTKKTEDTSETKNKTTTSEVDTTADKTGLVAQSTIITSNMIEVLENAVSANISPATVANTTINTNTTNTEQTDATAEQATTATSQIQGVNFGLNNALSKITENLTNNIQTTDNKGLTQAQQTLDAKVNQQNTPPNEVKSQAPEVIAADTSAQLKVSTETIAPVVIAADANIKTDSNTTDTKQNVKDTLNKTQLTQDMLDKTNAKIVSVDTSSSNSSNSNNLLNKQNAQEQAIKISLESNKTTSTSTDLSAITATSSQLDFSKTLDNVQNVQGQAPKDISNTDILAQINKQLDGLKEEGTTKVTIVLRPESLGKISLELVNGKDGLTAKMTTDSQQVKELLDKSLNSLKDTLSNQGVSVNNVSVKVNETQKQDSMFSFNEQTGQQQQNSHNSEQTNKNEFTFDKEMNSATEAEDAEISATAGTIGTESSISIGSHMGKVDYKV